MLHQQLRRSVRLKRRSRLASLGAGLVGVVVAGAGLPDARASLDGKRAGVDGVGSELSVRERALPGSVVALRSPGSRMIKIRGGTFTMGSTLEDVLEAVADCAREPLGSRCREEMFSDELSEHRVTLEPYWLDRTEVTVRDYARCVALRRCKAVPFDRGGKRFDRPSFPVSLVQHADAEAFCRYRGARLPTEAEFERAARGVTRRRYPWGALYNSHAVNHGRLGLDPTDDQDGFRELAPVGSFPSGRTPDGFLDLAGNVAEWTSDRYSPSYPPDAVTNPQGPGLGAQSASHVVRGGHYGSSRAWLRGAARASADPETRSPTLGFRCARSERTGGR